MDCLSLQREYAMFGIFRMDNFRNSSIIPQYLSFCFTSKYFKELMLSNVSGVGGSLMRAQPAIVNKYLFPLPPINEQCRIVAAIQEYYEILDNMSANL